ncbi:MAG: 16S rRNA (guanine(966)-N(2))-methyltransferase RsmD [Candidatus Omnitrophica bacterium]|nr:16S rRNA (guanine(966)-N(2))-methyltransferase RsmD [Candidatus Omnitrophota bacterium]
MRIIAGELKSRIIKFPKTKLTRPMTDRGRETVFNIIGSLIPGKHILDLYSGSGSIGLEAVSRGALDVIMVEQSPVAVHVIKQNIDLLGLKQKAIVLQDDVLRAIDKLKRKKQAFSLVFVDPPYDKGWVKKTLIRLDQSGIVLPFGQVVVGHSSYEEIPEDLKTLRLTRTKKVGQSRFSFLFRLESSHGETKSYLSGEF